MEQRICFTLLAHVVIFAMHFSPTLSDAETWSISVGCFPRYMSPLIKVITQIAACLLGLASLLSCGLILWLAGPTLHFTVIFLLYFFVEICVLVHWDEFLEWLLGMVACRGSIGEILPKAQSMWLQLFGGGATELPMIICHPCNLEAEHAGNPWKRKCLFWIIIFSGFQKQGQHILLVAVAGQSPCRCPNISGKFKTISFPETGTLWSTLPAAHGTAPHSYLADLSMVNWWWFPMQTTRNT